MLCRFRDSRNCSGGRSIGTPSSSRTSALPQLDVTRRLPCFTTTPPPAATTKATVVEILNESTPSPPVPQTCTIGPGISARLLLGLTARIFNEWTHADIHQVVLPVR